MTDASFVAAMSTATKSGTQAVTYSGVTGGSGIATDKTSLGQDAFLQLLVTQMKNQDPSSPMDSSQIIAQTAQLSTVEQLTQMTKSQQSQFALQQKLSAASLVGETVTYATSDGTPTTGVVSATSFTADGPTLTIDGKSVSLDSVTGVTTAAAAAAAAAARAAAAASGTSTKSGGSGGPASGS